MITVKTSTAQEAVEALEAMSKARLGTHYEVIYRGYIVSSTVLIDADGVDAKIRRLETLVTKATAWIESDYQTQIIMAPFGPDETLYKTITAGQFVITRDGDPAVIITKKHLLYFFNSFLGA